MQAQILLEQITNISSQAQNVAAVPVKRSQGTCLRLTADSRDRSALRQRKSQEDSGSRESNPYRHPSNSHVSLTAKQVERFVEEDCIPAETVFAQQLNANGRDTRARFSTHPPVLEDLKRKAQQLGLWNMFLPKAHFKEGAGFSNLEYGLMAELLGKSDIAPEVREIIIGGILKSHVPASPLSWSFTDSYRLAIAALPTLVTWKCLPSMGLRLRRRNGLFRY